MSDSICPSYRLRLFQSVDLVGSTAFKSKYAKWETGASNAVWVTQIQHFYREFPKLLAANFQKEAKSGRAPSVWKTIGDEIIFCCRLQSLEHLAACSTAFMRSLEAYGARLDDFDRSLDVKGAAWVAAFPGPNVSVDIASIRSPDSATLSSSDLADEQDELRADTKPSDFDFLGQHIDAGFRSARAATSDSMSLSLELAYLLAEAEGMKRPNGTTFHYHGRHALKGVINDRPYPVVTIDMERKETRRRVLQAERDITKFEPAKPHHLKNYLAAFMEDAGIELPSLPRDGKGMIVEPESYRRYAESWAQVREETQQRTEGEIEAASAASDGSDTLQPEITAALGGPRRIVKPNTKVRNRPDKQSAPATRKRRRIKSKPRGA